MRGILSGPSFAPTEDEWRRSHHGKSGGHYNTFQAKSPEKAMEFLREVFPDGAADEMNFVLFSTSGVHGSYATIEEAWDRRHEDDQDLDAVYGDETRNPDEGREVTFLLVQPRLVALTCGNVRIASDEDAAFLKRLRASSWDVVRTIGAPPEGEKR